MKAFQRIRGRRSPSSLRLLRPTSEAGNPGVLADSLANEPMQPSAEPYDIAVDRNAGEAAQIAFFTLDRRGGICELNENGATLLGFPSTWLLGRAFVVFVAREHVHPFLDALTHSIRNPHESLPIEVGLCVGSRTVPVKISIKPLPHETILRRMSVVDLTDVRRTGALLRESTANWYSLIQNAQDLILTLTEKGKISFANKAAWGHPVRALIGTSFLSHLPETERPKILECLGHAFGYNRQITCELAGMNGEWNRWYNVSFAPPHLMDRIGFQKAGESATTVVIREISEHKRIEQTLRVSGEQLRDFAGRLETAREDERARVARELHDDLGQALTVLKLDLAWVQSKTSPAAKTANKMKEMIVHIDEAIQRIRRISSDLRPAILDDLGLIAALEWQVREFRKHTKIRSIFHSNTEDLQLPVPAAAAVFRVVQEALTNVMRHAKATKLSVRLESQVDALRISIDDNGRGMARSQGTDSPSLGLVGMRERIVRLRGTMNISSETGKGTRIDIVIPIEHD